MMWNILLGFISFWMSIAVTPEKIIKYLEANGQRERENLSFVTPETVRVSCVQLNTHRYSSLVAYLSDMLTHTKTAAASGAHVVVFPEYTGLFAGTLIPCYERMIHWVTNGKLSADIDHITINSRHLTKLVEAFHNYIYETYMYTFSTLARLQHIYIVAGTSLFYEQGKLYHRSIVFAPDGQPIGTQDKISAIGFDRALGITPSDHIEVIPTPMGNLSVVIGSDAYYFECFKIAREKGTQIFAVPDSRDGVLHDLLRCRANEYGAYMLYSCIAGKESNSETRAGIFAPLAVTPQKDGIIAHVAGVRTDVVNSRINLQRLERLGNAAEPNPVFLAGDYVRSYRYCGNLPMITPIEPLEESN